ncbi:hypothetical protein [Sphingomonas morindae]|uniref:PRC-barrel domain-containing protein n=1 Tax=Sphingomonas morindae TaxID=1541170 RepID=A0ABY4X5F0_9SPHN|nr:hypothetical protein [Sphingomonas morindae]USI72106.1 hypothetical protein LHA26_12425 [Sphingomonas morindae]
MTKTTILAAASAFGLIAATPLFAQTAPAAAPADGAATSAPAVAQGATVYDPQGGTVGTVESVDGDFVVLATAANKVRLPKSSFGTGPKGPMIAMTAAQLDQAAAQAMPQGAAAAGAAAGATASANTQPNVAKGAQVTDTQGGAVGTVAEVDSQFATVELATGGKVRLPVSAFGAGLNGGLRVAMTAQQLSAAASAAGGAGKPGAS